jgi:hypothetical protein
MIDKVSLSPEWLAEKQNEYKKDPSLIESMIHALYLLERLKLTGLDFIFKGGTSLLLLLENPARFSVDIDIIVNPVIKREILEDHLEKILNEVFIRMELDERRSHKGKIPKAHYKFFYNSNVPTKNKDNQVIPNPEREILLDVLFAENPYPVLLEKPILTNWIKQNGEPLTVKMPCGNSIAGDKLTAYAPNTIGVPYKVEKEKEIIKQLFDIGTLFDILTDVNVFRKSFHATATGEISYRPEREITIEIVLQDVITTGIILAKRDAQEKEDEEKFAELKKGINQFGHFVYVGNFRIEEAQLAGAKAAYLAAHILSKTEEGLKRFDEAIEMKTYLIERPEYNFLNKRLKFIAKGEALFYWNEVIKLLHP